MPQAYSYVKTLCVDSGFLNTWYEITDSSIALSTLYSTCRKFYVVVNVVTDTTPVAVDMSSLQYALDGSSLSVADWLTANGNATLPTIPVPVFNPKYVKYGDAFRLGYTAHVTAPGIPYQNTTPYDTQTEIVLTRDSTDYLGFDTDCMVTVNGYFHNHDSDTNSVYVIDGVKSLRKCGCNQVGIYSFKDVGKMTRIPLKGLSLFPAEMDGKLSDRLVVDLGSAAVGKYIMFVVAGYLIPVAGDIITQRDDSVWTFSLERFNWLDRYMEANKYLDFSSLGLTVVPTNANLVNTDELYSDQTIANLFAMSQSFAVALDCDNFFFETKPLPLTKLPGVYRTENYLGHPLMIGKGRMAEYWVEPSTEANDPMVGLFVADNVNNQRMYDTADPTSVNVDHRRIPLSRELYSDAFWVNMGKDS